jgi:hypothetical protein
MLTYLVIGIPVDKIHVSKLQANMVGTLRLGLILCLIAVGHGEGKISKSMFADLAAPVMNCAAGLQRSGVTHSEPRTVDVCSSS